MQENRIGTINFVCFFFAFIEYRSYNSRDIHILWPWGEFFFKVKNREEFEGGLEKRKGKGGKRRKKEENEKTHARIPL